MLIHKINRQYIDPGETLQNTETPTINAGPVFDQMVPPGIDTFYDFPAGGKLKRAELASMLFFASGACTVATNGAGVTSPSSATDIIDLNAAGVYVWTLAQDTLVAGPGLVKCPISADITAGIYITNLTSPPVTIRVKIEAGMVV